MIKEWQRELNQLSKWWWDPFSVEKKINNKVIRTTVKAAIVRQICITSKKKPRKNNFGDGFSK